jgi:hypothetical protein
MGRKPVRFKDGEEILVEGRVLMRFKRKHRKGKGSRYEVTLNTPQHIPVHRIRKKRG